MNGASCKWAPLPLRLMIGVGFMYHGYPKLFTSEGHGAFVGMLQNIGIPAPGVAAWGVGVVEFVGGLALVLGAFVSAAAVLRCPSRIKTPSAPRQKRSSNSRPLPSGRASWTIPAGPYS